MATTQQKRDWWADWRCNPIKMVAVTFPGSGRDWNLPVADAAAPAFELFASLMRKHDYLFREVSGGTYNCRYIGGTTSWSLHAYGIAIDLNPSKNPYGTTRHNFPQDFIEEVLATGLFRWGMSFRDPMHWEIDVPPSAIGEDLEMPLLPIVKGDSGEDVTLLKKLLNDVYGESLLLWPISYDNATSSAVARRLARYSGAKDAEKGEFVNGMMFAGLLTDLAKKHGGASGTHNHDGRYVKNVSVSR